MNEKIESIMREVRARRYQDVKSLLDELDVDLEKLEKLQGFFYEIKKWVEEYEK